MMSNSEDSAHGAGVEAIKAAIEKRLTAFDRYKDDLLGHLENVCAKTKSFDPDKSWRHLRFEALRYLDASSEQKQMEVPPAHRVKLLLQLGDTLKKARCKLDEARHHDIRGVLFVEWCEAHGHPDFTDPRIDLFDREFDKVVTGLIASLADLETFAERAAEYVRRERGRPGGTSVLPHDFLISLESTYRNITGKPGRVGWGPFAQFVDKFLEAVGRKSKKKSLIRTIKAAKQHEQKDPATSRWGRQDPGWKRALLLARTGGKIPPKSP